MLRSYESNEEFPPYLAQSDAAPPLTGYEYDPAINPPVELRRISMNINKEEEEVLHSAGEVIASKIQRRPRFTHSKQRGRSGRTKQRCWEREEQNWQRIDASAPSCRIREAKACRRALLPDIISTKTRDGQRRGLTRSYRNLRGSFRAESCLEGG